MTMGSTRNGRVLLLRLKGKTFWVHYQGYGKTMNIGHYGYIFRTRKTIITLGICRGNVVTTIHRFKGGKVRRGKTIRQGTFFVKNFRTRLRFICTTLNELVLRVQVPRQRTITLRMGVRSNVTSSSCGRTGRNGSRFF